MQTPEATKKAELLPNCLLDAVDKAAAGIRLNAWAGFVAEIVGQTDGDLLHLTSSSCHPEILIEQECDFLMTLH